MQEQPYSRDQHIKDVTAAIAKIKPKYDASVGREAYKLGAKLRALQTELNNIL